MVKVTSVVSGAGDATINPPSFLAGSIDNRIYIKFTAKGTMDGGKARITIPNGWGKPQKDDPIKHNYVRLDRPSGVSLGDIDDYIIDVNLTDFDKGDSFTLTYGVGNRSAIGAIAPDNTGESSFTIKVDGDNDENFVDVVSAVELTDAEKARTAGRGKVYEGAAGVLKVIVEAAADGTGTATVETIPEDTTIHAAADDIELKFIYTATQTIEAGQLIFNIPNKGWSIPQLDNTETAGYTRVDGIGLGDATSDDEGAITVPIVELNKGNTIEIFYGASANGRVEAHGSVGEYTFLIETQGDKDGDPKPLLKGSPEVTVVTQASGGGMAIVGVSDDLEDDDALYAGQKGRELTITYTAAGEMMAGKVKLTIPKDWSAPKSTNVVVMPSTFDVTYGGDASPSSQDVTVESVGLDADGMITFVYTGDVQDTAKAGVEFVVETDSGLGDTDDFKAVSVEEPNDLKVDVQEAKAGSGEGSVNPRIVETGESIQQLTFTYTAAGEASYPREIRVTVPRSWGTPSDKATSPDNSGTYSVVHKRSNVTHRGVVSELDPEGQDMIARINPALKVLAGDQIILTYENITAPAADAISEFQILFDGIPAAGETSVRVQGASATQLALNSRGTVSADPGEASLAVTVSLQDDDGTERATANPVAVTLRSSSATGTFSEDR